jgi:GNAT superfamily N-acetyltransferase
VGSQLRPPRGPGRQRRRADRRRRARPYARRSRASPHLGRPSRRRRAPDSGLPRRRLVGAAPPDEPDADLLAVAELDEHALRGIREEISVEYEDSPQLRAQLLFAQQIAAEELDVRYFGVRQGPRIVSGCELYSRGGVAQVEDVVTHAEFRNRGFARAVVLRAVEAARSTGHDLVFLLAEEDDWPQELYTRLGFEPVARLHAFLKRSP